ncbi:hypothetical protein VTH82DRAFT_6054 [Thermothelomyces myriococcoides]
MAQPKQSRADAEMGNEEATPGNRDSKWRMSIDHDMPYGKRLYRHMHNDAHRHTESHFLIFRDLQRLNLLRLQIDLAKIKSRTDANMALCEEDMAQLTSLLHDYG